MNQINDELPLNVKKNLNYPDVIQMMKDDPTEAINSDKIIPTTYKLFEVIKHTKSGGVIAYELLTHNDKLYNTELSIRREIVNNIMAKDKEYLDLTGDSFFHFIISKNSKKLSSQEKNNLISQMQKREKIAASTFGHYSYNILPMNQTIYCNDNQHWGKSFFVHGFSDVEHNGRWTIGNKSMIRFKNHNIQNGKKLIINVKSMPNYSQAVEIKINKTVSSYNILNDEKLILDIINDPKNLQETIILFNFRELKTPKALGINNDGRELGLFFRDIKLLGQ